MERQGAGEVSHCKAGAWHDVDKPTREGKRVLDEPKRKRPREEPQRAEDRRGRELSGHGKERD